MTHTSLYSEFLSFNENRSRKSFFSKNSARRMQNKACFSSAEPQPVLFKNIYQVVVNGEDGEYAEFEIEAKNENEAKAIAERLAAESMVNIMYIEVNRYE